MKVRAVEMMSKMKIFDTLSAAEKTELVLPSAPKNGRVGIFEGIYSAQSGAKYANLLGAMSTHYYLTRSGDKPVSKSYDRVIEILGVSDDFTEANTAIGRMAFTKFDAKWGKIFDALDIDYNVIDGYIKNKTHTGTDTDTTTYGKTLSKEGTNNDTITYGKTLEKSSSDAIEKNFGKTVSKTGENESATVYGKTESESRTTQSETITAVDSGGANDIYGFNSTAPVGADVDTNSSNTTVSQDPEKNKTDTNKTFGGTDKINSSFTGSETHGGKDTESVTRSNSETHGGSDTNSVEKSETETHGGSDQRDRSVNWSVEESGRNKDGAALVTGEIVMRSMYQFIDIVCADIDSIATMKIYL